MKHLCIFLSSIFLVSSCSLWPSSPDSRNTTMDPQPNSSGTTQNYMADLDAMSGKIKNTEEFQSCMKQNTNMCIQSTGMQLAQQAKDPAFCKELLTADQQSSCEFAVTMINATEKSDEKICDTIKDANYQKQCQAQIYRQQAISKKDISLCDKIVDESQEAGSGIALDANMQKNQCIMQYIMSSSDTDTKNCDKISNTGSVDMCKMMIKNRPTTNTIPPANIKTSPAPSLQSAPTR